ncbi:MAG: DUF4254 domain-containing protein [Bernardetiaceae bacterium]|nr:DUF4254 domain-containing protein [Bernardetiaceae bacterium]
MPLSSADINLIFRRSIRDYHKTDSVDAPIINPYPEDSLSYLLYLKNWIDTVQWHLEDIIRRPDISAEYLVAIKRRIDTSNQARTDTVENIDDVFVEEFSEIRPQSDARLNSETPAWLLDRLSILQLKIYHMQEQTERQDAPPQHIANCEAKLDVLRMQEIDLSLCYDELIEDIIAGRRYTKVYRQMKMYNDPKLNPALYADKKS